MSGAIATAAIVGGIGAAGSLGSAAIGSHAAGKAASAQQNAANQAAQYQQQASNKALDFQNGIWNQTQQNYAPYIQAGGGALNQLQYLLGTGNAGGFNPTAPAQGLSTPSANPTKPVGSAAMPTTGINQINQGLTGATPQSGAVGAVPSIGSLNGGLNPSGSPQLPGGVPHATPALGSGAGPSVSGGDPTQGGFGSLTQRYGQTFQAPDGLTEQNDPGYQARLKLGTDAIQRSAAARGGVLTGGTAKALDQFGQDYGSNEYDKVYSRALTGFGTNYGVWNNDNNNIYSRLMGLLNSGQSAVGSLAGAGQAAAGNVTGNLLGTGQQIGQDYGNAGAANASGVYNSAGAWGGALNSIGGQASQLYQLQQLQNMYGGGSGGSGGTWI